MKLKTTYYSFALPHLPADLKGLKILHLSDLHGVFHGKEQKNLMDKIISEKPELILLTGDIADDLRPFAGTGELLIRLKKIAPVYYCTGNHENRAKCRRDLLRHIRFYDVNVLEGANCTARIRGTDVLITGIDVPESSFRVIDRQSAADQLKQLYDTSRLTIPSILLCHHPELHTEFAKYDYDLVFTGHTHGGQIRLPPFINGLYAPGQGILPKYAGGVYELVKSRSKRRTWMIVNRGLFYSKYPRFFNPPELVIVTLE